MDEAMENQPESLSVRFLRAVDQGAIERVQRAAQNVSVILNSATERVMALREKAHSIDTSIAYPGHGKIPA
jgi:hypothetical protein